MSIWRLALLAGAHAATFGTWAAPPAALPRCIASSCGHAISFDTTGASGKPLCLCNHLCQDWKSTPGILPCCPGLQEVCLDPYRSPSPRPLNAPAASVSMASAVNGMAPAFNGIQSTVPFAPMTNIVSMTSVGPASIMASVGFPSVVYPMPPPVNAATAAFPPFSPPAATALPTCRPSSCGMGMVGSDPTTAVCVCDASCLVLGAILPCCQAFRETCQSAVPASAIAPISFGVALGAPAFSAQTSFPMQQLSVTPAPAFAPKPVSSACALGKTPWAEQPSCDKKRWAIQSGVCKKVCPSADSRSVIQYYPTGQAGKDACAAALALCN